MSHITQLCNHRDKDTFRKVLGNAEIQQQSVFNIPILRPPPHKIKMMWFLYMRKTHSSHNKENISRAIISFIQQMLAKCSPCMRVYAANCAGYTNGQNTCKIWQGVAQQPIIT